MLHSLSYPLNQLILSNQTSPKPGEPVCHPAGLSLPAFCDSSSTFSFEGTGVTIFSTVTSPPPAPWSGRKAARGMGCRQPHLTRHNKGAKTSFRRRWDRTGCGVWTAVVAQKNQTGSDLDQDRIGSDLLSHFQETALYCRANNENESHKKRT